MQGKKRHRQIVLYRHEIIVMQSKRFPRCTMYSEFRLGVIISDQLYIPDPHPFHHSWARPLDTWQSIV
jgi:hypothetical protein